MSSLIGRFLTGEYIVKRSSRGTYQNGNYVAGPEEEIKVFGSMQPTNARELKLAEEGSRLRQYFKFYTDEQILVDSEKKLSKSDRICVNGDEFKAMSSNPWQNIVQSEFKGIDLPYFMTVIWREPEQESDSEGSGL